jgi:phthalate 4,5-cis-dihydrodiol dehydrogenase
VAEGRRLRIGVAGLGRAFTVMLPTFAADPRVQLVAAADPRAEARERFVADFSAQAYETVAELCADPAVEIVYVATPHQHHAAHAIMATQHGKHVLVEKPMALTLEDCEAMIAATRDAKVQLIVGHSHSFDTPILRTRELLAGERFGPLKMIHALNYTDFIRRPRRPEELDTAQGGGAVFNQAAHQVDIVRLLGGGLVKSVRAQIARTDLRMVYLTPPVDASYAALLTFESGVFASLVYGGLGHFDTDEFSEWIGEMGQVKDTSARRAQPNFASAEEEAAYKAARNYGGPDYKPPAAPALAHQHFGTVIVSCQHADLQPLPTCVKIHAYANVQIERLSQPTVPRGEVIDELYAAVVNDTPQLHDGAWAMATLEVCLAILQSSREGRDIALSRQVAR